MNALNRIALLAGGALVAAAATGCSSSTKPAASAPASNAPSTSTSAAAPSTSASVPNTAVGGTSALAGGGSTTAADNGSSSTGGNADNGGNGGTSGGNGGTTSTAANTPPPAACDNSKVNASLAPRISGQQDSVFVIAVKNVGPTCTLGPIPYVWITKSPTDVSEETRPLIPSVDTGKKNIILTGTTLYAAIDLLPGANATATGDFGDLAVTASVTPDVSGKDVQDVQLPSALPSGGAKLGIYALTPASAINQIQYATTPEK